MCKNLGRVLLIVLDSFGWSNCRSAHMDLNQLQFSGFWIPLTQCFLHKLSLLPLWLCIIFLFIFAFSLHSWASLSSCQIWCLSPQQFHIWIRTIMHCWTAADDFSADFYAVLCSVTWIILQAWLQFLDQNCANDESKPKYWNRCNFSVRTGLLS